MALKAIDVRGSGLYTESKAVGVKFEEKVLHLDDFRNDQGKIPENITGVLYETIEELADRTKLPKSWWYAQTRKTGPGSVHRIKMGKYLRFIPSDVDAWLKEQQ